MPPTPSEERAELERRVAQVDQDIDAAAYALYGLTDSERGLVNGPEYGDEFDTNWTFPMNSIIESNQQQFVALCKRYRVGKIELFGSAVDERFDADSSDLDFLVVFEGLGPGEYADAYFGLQEALQELFRLPVDLVVATVIKNPYFLEQIAKTRTLLYAS